MNKIVKYIILDIARNKIVMAYTAFLLLISLSVFNLEDNSAKGIISLLNITLIIVPLVSIVFATIYLYNAAEFIELLVSQPIRRTRLMISLFTGLALSLSLAFLVGAGIPVLIYHPAGAGSILVAVGTALTLVFTSLAVLAAVLTRDKAKGIGVAILLWFYFALIFDGIILFILFQFSEYPMEKASIALSTLNPIDLGRIIILLKMDISAMMGYSGAVFRQFLGGLWGSLYAGVILLLWITTPLFWALRRFARKDL